MSTNSPQNEDTYAADAALEPLGMTVDRPNRRSHRDQLKLFDGPTDDFTESARDLVRRHPLQAIGIALLIGVMLGR